MDSNKIRQDFTIFDTRYHNNPLIFFDNAATTQKPNAVLSAMQDFYQHYNANVHRGVYHLTHVATELFEQARLKVKKFINASDEKSCIFTRGTTEAINIVAHGIKPLLNPNDEIIITQAEHHANIVPWQFACQDTGAKLITCPVDNYGQIDIIELEKIINPKVKLISIAHVINTFGTIRPVNDIIKLAHKHSIPVMLDGAQAAPFLPLDMQALDCDFYCFSGHKMYGPNGVGVLYGKTEWLEKLQPLQYGGEMIKNVTIEKTTINDLPFKFEAGTPATADIIGLGKAIDYLLQLDKNKIREHESNLREYLIDKFSSIPQIKVLNHQPNQGPIVPFMIDGKNCTEFAQQLGEENIAIRSGRLCAEPFMQLLDIKGILRASFGIYNTKAEIDKLIQTITKLI